MKMRVAYAKSRYKDTVYTTPLVVTSYRDENGISRNKTLASLAKLPDSIVKMIEKALKSGDSNILEEFVHIDQIQHQHSIVIGPVFVVWHLLKQLGIFSLIRRFLSFKQASIILAVIVERVVSAKPISMMAQQRLFAKGPLAFLLGIDKSPALNTWYNALSKLEAKREEILQELYKRNHAPGELYLYDITSSYFEGVTCPLADYGYNRDGKKGKKQVVIGVICDDEGCPLWVDVFQGNTADQSTVKQQMLNLRDKLKVEKFTFVGDRGMLTHARIEELEDEGWWKTFCYITALKRSEMMSLVEDESHPIQAELFDYQNLAEVEKDGVRYVLCHNPNRQMQDGEARLRLLEQTESKLENIKANVQKGRLKKKDVIARRLHRWINRWGMERFFDVQYAEGEFSFSRKTDEIERYARLDGCYVIRSNSTVEQQSTQELRDRYKDLKYVEQTFRTMKTTDIQVRPIRHFNEDQVRGHIFACFLAYRVIWELRKRLHPVLMREPKSQRCEAGSLVDIWRELELISIAKLSVKNRVILKLSQVSAYAKKLLTLCKVPTLDDLLSE